MNSPTAQFYFLTFSIDQQRNLISGILSDILFSIEDTKTRDTVFKQVVDECLAKKPYSKILVLTILEDPSLNERNVDLARVLKSSNKTLSSEDLMQLGVSQRGNMTEFERRYLAYGVEGAKFENELAKIMNRYANEGRADQYAPDMSKHVSFDQMQQQDRFD